MTDAHQPFRILTVCTGNIARSPAAERLLQSGLGPSVRVASAGTGAVVGAPMDKHMVILLEENGINTSGFTARAVTEQLLSEAELILPMTLEHRAHLVEMAPATVRRTFTLLEFAALVADLAEEPGIPPGTPGEALRQLTQAAVGRRATMRQAISSFDVPDPHGKHLDHYVKSLIQIESATELLTELLVGNEE